MTDWSNVKVESNEPPAPPPPSIVGRLVTVIVFLALLLVGGVFLNVVLLGTRVRERSVKQCDGPGCVLRLKQKHDECYRGNIGFVVPASTQAFQTPVDANELGFVVVDYEGYKACADLNKPKTLADAEPAEPTADGTDSGAK